MKSINQIFQCLKLFLFYILLNNYEVLWAQNSNQSQIYFSIVQRETHLTYGFKPSEIGLYSLDYQSFKTQHLAWQNNLVWGILIDTLSQNQKIYLACSNGVMQSIDKGSTWKIISNHLIKEVQNIYISSVNPSEIYACTAYGLWKSNNAGNNWAKIDFKKKKVGYNFVRSFFTHPTYPTLHFVGTAEGLLISKKIPNTWRVIPAITSEVYNIIYNPRQLSQIFCATENGIYLSNNYGANWQLIDYQKLKTPIYALAIAQSDSSRLFGGGYQTGLYISNNSGQNWILLSNELQSQTILSIAIHPKNANILAVGTHQRGLWVSKDGGQNFVNIENTKGKVWQVVFE